MDLAGAIGKGSNEPFLSDFGYPNPLVYLDKMGIVDFGFKIKDEVDKSWIGHTVIFLRQRRNGFSLVEWKKQPFGSTA
jgi:hypothetical protein